MRNAFLGKERREEWINTYNGAYRICVKKGSCVFVCMRERERETVSERERLSEGKCNRESLVCRTGRVRLFDVIL